MKGKLVANRSSYLVNLPVLAVCLILGVLMALWGLRLLAAVLLFYVLLGGLARIWGVLSANRLVIQLTGDTAGAFPGETLTFHLRVKNEKFLPLLWAEVFFPLEKRLCLTPEEMRPPEDWEKPALEEGNASLEQVGEARLPSFLWYEERTVEFHWQANRRGIYSTQGWRLRTGDGFGLSQVEHPLTAGRSQQLAVYPKLVEVSPELFLRNQWNADTGARGVMEDPTVIRSTRAYQSTDSVKRINWRMVARGLPVTVNVYEEILPRSIGFLFDGESFGGQGREDALEDALSILASELVRLEEEQVEAALCLPRGKHGGAFTHFGGGDLESLLFALAGYEPEAERKDQAGIPIPRSATFDLPAILEGGQRVGHFYYITYSTQSITAPQLLEELGSELVTILTVEEETSYGEFEVLCLNSLREGGGAV
jgi:hypothetical protein